MKFNNKKGRMDIEFSATTILLLIFLIIVLIAFLLTYGDKLLSAIKPLIGN